MERLGDHPDREDARLLGAARHDRGRAGAGAAAHAGGDKHHVRALQVTADLLEHLVGGSAPDLGLRAGTKTLGDLDAHLDDVLGLRGCERLGVSVGDNEFATLQPTRDHVVDRISTSTTNPDYSDPRLQLADVGHFRIGCPSCLFLARCSPPGLGRSATGRWWVVFGHQKLSRSHRPTRAM